MLVAMEEELESEQEEEEVVEVVEVGERERGREIRTPLSLKNRKTSLKI